MEIAAGIHRVEIHLGERICAMYLLVGTELTLLIDTAISGALAAAVIPYLAEIGVGQEQVRLVLVSHADVDHSGDTAAAKKLFPNALLACHRDDAAEIDDIEVMISRRYEQFATDHGIDDPPTAKAWVRDAGKAAPVDLLLTGGERIRLGDGWEVEVLHTPGHSRGHITIWDPRNRAAIIADAVLWKGINSSSGASVLPPTYRYVDAYRTTIGRIEALRPEWLLTSHFPVMGGGGVAPFLAESRAFVDQVDETTLIELGDSPLMTSEVIRRVGPLIGPWPVDDLLSAIAFPLVGHLEHLAALGKIRVDRNFEGLVTWSAAS